MELTLVLLIIIVGLTFDFTNGFHDAANAIATSISTRALTPRVALAMAAVMNFCGAFLGTGVAQTVGSGIIGAPGRPPGCCSSCARSSAPLGGTSSPGGGGCPPRPRTP